MPPADYLGVTWSDLTERVERRGALAAWATAEPALSGVSTVEELAAAVRGGSPDEANELLGATVRLGARDSGDDEDAAMLAAHLLASRARQIAHQLRDLSSDIDALVASELWLQIRAFESGRRVWYASRLIKRTRAALTADLLPYRRRGVGAVVLLVDPPALSAMDGSNLRLTAGARADSLVWPAKTDVGLLRLLAWAQRSGVVTAADVSLLVDLVAAGHSGPCHNGGLNSAAEVAEVAQRLGMSTKTVLRRRDRAVAALVRSRDRYLAEAA
jgi:hypothetical protein